MRSREERARERRGPGRVGEKKLKENQTKTKRTQQPIPREHLLVLHVRLPVVPPGLFVLHRRAQETVADVLQLV